MGKRTPLFQEHVGLGAKIVDFGGWDMPLHYGSQVNEHHAVRQHVGMFDVSHMTVIDISGEGAGAFLQHLLANDIGRLHPGQALYTAMLNDKGGVIDDLIVYEFNGDYRIVSNSATRDKNLQWLLHQAADFPVVVCERPALAMIAVQGPSMMRAVADGWGDGFASRVAALKPFYAASWQNGFVARTGYTGEVGFEIILPAEEAVDFWRTALEAGIQPCGLGARDTLRLEAGMNLYGAEMDETLSPLAANMGWTIAWDPASRDFIGRGALESQRASGNLEKLVGLVLPSGGILRAGQIVTTEGQGTGIVTSGSYSPTLGCSIALARVPAATRGNCSVTVRNRALKVRMVRPAFVRQGRSLVSGLESVDKPMTTN